MSNIEVLKNNIEYHFKNLNSINNILDPVIIDDTFYIYTTGIANLEQYDLINIWDKCRYKHIIGQIPDNFKNIVIEHYDPILDTYGYKVQDTSKITKYITDILIKQDNTSKTILKRQTKQTFIPEKFNYRQINKTQHYIILDFDQSFYYYYDKLQKEYYMTKNDFIIDKLNCIYIPYPTDCNSFWEKIKYFKYDTSTKEFTSYIELLLKVLSNNTQYKTIIDNSKLYESNDYNHNIILYKNSEDINMILNKILYEGQIYPYIKSYYYNRPIPLEIYVYSDKNIKDTLFVDFFNKLFILYNNNLLFDIYNNKILFDIYEYDVLTKLDKKILEYEQTY
jgi:hypothetical protein